MPPKESKKRAFSQGCFHLRKPFSQNSQSGASQELGQRLRERPTWDKVTTHYAALPHFVVLNGLNKCNNKTVSQALKYNYRKIIFCSLYVNCSTASTNVCQIPPGIQVWLVFSLLTNFLCLSVTLSPSNIHTLAHTLNQMHLVILFATVGLSKPPFIVCDMPHSLSQNALPATPGLH